MALFQRKQSFLGIDIGTSSIKAVELKNEAGRPKLVTYGYIEQQSDLVKSDSPQAQARLLATIKHLVQQAGVTTDKVVAALPSFAVFTSIISLPVMSEKDLLAAVRWEAKKFVPMPLDEMILDWRVIKEPETPQAQQQLGVKKRAKDLKILLTAAPKNLVKRYVDLFKAADMQLVSLETESFALERSLIGNDPSPIMVIDIGAIATDISVISHGIPLLNRSIDVGGETITKSIMNSLNIDVDRAEQFKRDFGMGTSDGNQQIPKTIEFVIGSIINETRYCLNLYQGQGQQTVEKVILAGGSSFLPSLPDYLARVLNLKVFIGDPWARVIYPIELKSALQEIGPRFAVAIGLAMRNIV
ncbi:MAG: type IV pilus assembly protein PilM [Candidatus Kerfeldbacteria bacterium]|nr:type IV pilus assembly protein PilM [Candidatus Kerfeldbacteria bacterium]